MGGIKSVIMARNILSAFFLKTHKTVHKQQDQIKFRWLHLTNLSFINQQQELNSNVHCCQSNHLKNLLHFYIDFKTDTECHAGKYTNYTLSNVVTVEGKYENYIILYFAINYS